MSKQQQNFEEIEFWSAYLKLREHLMDEKCKSRAYAALAEARKKLVHGEVVDIE